MSKQAKSDSAGAHEGSELPLRPFLWCLAGLILTGILIHLGLIGYGIILKNSYKRFGQVSQIRLNDVPTFPSPALQQNPRVDFQTYRSRAERDLNTYGWIDETRGIVKIPIDRAMALVAARDLPVRPPVQDGPTELDLQNQKAAAENPPSAQPP
jgi:hypothetical protein